MTPGNPLVGGTVLRRPAIASPNYAAGSSGWSVNSDGSAEFNNLTIRGTFDGVDFEINASGAFFYSGTPASGNLIASMAAAAGTDAHGNAYVQGSAVYASGVILSMGHDATIGASGFFMQSQTSAATIPPFVFGTPSASGSSLELYSGQSTNVAAAATLSVEDSLASGITGGQILALAGAVDMSNVTSVYIAAGGGPFINGEGFHAISLPGGLSGTCRVKKLPWNGIWLDIDVAFTYSGTQQTFTLGSLPDSTYYPVSARRFPMRATGTISSTTVHEGVSVPTSGALTLQVPAGSGGGNQGCSVMYPSN